MDYRQLARQHLEKARAELAAPPSEGRVRYAALELRFAIEAITYDRAAAYSAELPPAVYETWQPKQLMAVLIDNDPNADKDSTIAMALEDASGQPIEPFKSLGTEVVFSMAKIKRHYDALGSYLHMPTVAQLRKGSTPNVSRLRQRCEELADELDKVLQSPIFNSTFGVFATLDCLRCGKPIKKRTLHLNAGETVEARCHSCGAPYTVRKLNDQTCTWRGIKVDLICDEPSCAKENQVWRDQVATGKVLRCIHCDARSIVTVMFDTQLTGKVAEQRWEAISTPSKRPLLGYKDRPLDGAFREAHGIAAWILWHQGHGEIKRIEATAAPSPSGFASLLHDLITISRECGVPLRGNVTAYATAERPEMDQERLVRFYRRLGFEVTDTPARELHYPPRTTTSTTEGGAASPPREQNKERE